MRISLNWLRELVDVNLSPEELAKTLTIAGFEVEEIEDRHTLAAGVVVGKVVECQPHPNADKLSVCQVDIGEKELSQIVCGAANVKVDIYVPVATVGAYLPAVEIKIKAAKLRGERSAGMICSLAELGLAKESEGIYIFPGEDLVPGKEVAPLLGLNDLVLDLATTANRADALSMVGVAREVAALTGGKVKLPPSPELEVSSQDGLKLDIADAKACPAYIGTVIKNLQIAPSPEWLKWRLEAAGVRPINNIVDITNYVLLEWGQPLHAFDLQRLQAVAGGNNLIMGVGFSAPGESLKTLDGQERQLKSSNLLIQANGKPIALAGVMGGEATEVHEETQEILLEAALFDPVVIRRSSRSQNLRTEASSRYERSVNQAELAVACNRGIALLQELAGGNVVKQAIADARPDPSSWSRSIELRLSRINQILGQVKQGDGTGYITQEDVEKILTALGCQLTSTDSQTWTVKVPPYRYRDLEREIDLIEEVARLYGYDHFCDTLPSKTQPGYLPSSEKVKRKVRRAFQAVGLTEVVHYSLVKPEGEEVVLDNPLFSEYSSLRTDLLGGLINAFQYNYSRGNGSLNAFEFGRIFWRGEEGLGEADSVAGILGGDFYPQGRWLKGGKSVPITWFEAKGCLESAFALLGLQVEYQPSNQDERLHPGRTASLWISGKRLGTFGQIHPQLRKEKDLPDEVYIFILSAPVLLETLEPQETKSNKFQPFSTYPAAERDIAFFASVETSVAQLVQGMKKAGGKLLNKVELFDEYQGENVPEGERSLAFSLAYRASDRTLTEQDIEPVHQKVREALTDKFRVTLRS